MLVKRNPGRKTAGINNSNSFHPPIKVVLTVASIIALTVNSSLSVDVLMIFS